MSTSAGQSANIPIPNDDTFPLISAETRKNSLGYYRSIEVHNDEDNIELDDQSIDEEHDKTNVMQTFIHLLKGYMGAGCLSLPWALSQLGLVYGSIAIFVVSYWSSLNCWTIVKLKRFIERDPVFIDDKGSEASSVTTNTQITYADVGQYFYGSRFETYVAACVCIQQLAICTVFISFVGENILAVMKHLGWTFMATHTGVMTLELPLILSLSLIPNLKSLTPVMTAGTVLLLVTFFAIGVIIQKEWPTRPMDPIEFELASAPLAVSAILYSYEGINLILPVESAMLDPKYFKMPFISAMTAVAGILVSFALICVLTFGYVDNGSVTAFLIQAYPDDPDVLWWVMMANASVSLSVLMTYPLQLFPALQLLAPPFTQFVNRLTNNTNAEDDAEDDLSAFEPLPPLPEHDIPSLDSWGEHQYNTPGDNLDSDIPDPKVDGESNSVAHSAMTSMQSMMPQMTMPGDSMSLRVTLVMMTYAVAVAVPNVQALISLAGALAGSSSALLIPPLLELAWINNLETSGDDTTAGATTTAETAAAFVAGKFKNPESRWTMLLPGTEHFGLGKWWFEKLKCYVLFILGFLFFCIGTYTSVADIVKIYIHGVDSVQ